MRDGVGRARGERPASRPPPRAPAAATPPPNAGAAPRLARAVAAFETTRDGGGADAPRAAARALAPLSRGREA